MKRVGIIKQWDQPDLQRQTPGSKGRWGDFEFIIEPVQPCDYVIVLNLPKHDLSVRCRPDCVWAVIQEPPERAFRWMHRGIPAYSRIYTPAALPLFPPGRYIPSQPALPWHVNRSYDQLAADTPAAKDRRLSWITSSRTFLPGHRKRMGFLEKIRSLVDFDLYGFGFRPLEDKWDGLQPYRYSLAIENYSGPHYWSEKLADCFLAWTMPIYYGCTNLAEFFPEESFVQIHLEDPDAPSRIQEIIHSDLREKHLDAIAESRRRVLDVHQFFPFIAREIEAHQQEAAPRRPIDIRLAPKFSRALKMRLLFEEKWRLLVARLGPTVSNR